MKTTLSVSMLNEIMDLMSRYVSRHATLPILENVYISGSGTSLLFRAADMEKYLEIEIDAEMDDEAALTVNAKTFSDILKTIDESLVTLTIGESSELVITTTKDDFKIRGISATEYVAIPEVQSDISVDMDISVFSKGISKVEYAVTEKNFSPVLTGVLIKIKDHADTKELIFVGTDGFRLAEYKTTYTGTGNTCEMIVPKVHINDIKKVADYALAKELESMTMKVSQNMMECSYTLKGMRIVTSCLLIQGAFPQYDQESIMPTQREVSCLIEKDHFDKAIKKIAILTRDLNNYIFVTTEQDQVTLSSGETDRGNAETSAPGLIEGPSVSYGVNGKYIADFLRIANSQEIMMRVIDGQQPIVFKDQDDDRFTYVVRPLVK